MTPAQRDNIARAFAPVTSQMEALQRGLAPAVSQLRAFQEKHGESILAVANGLAEMGRQADEAREMEARIWAVTPRDRRPEIRRLLHSLRDAPLAVVVSAMAEALRFVQDPFYRLFPTARAWRIVHRFYLAIRGEITKAFARAEVSSTERLVLATPFIYRHRPDDHGPVRRPSRIAERLSANAPPRPHRHPRQTSGSVPMRV
jgi:hypothetical protein